MKPAEPRGVIFILLSPEGKVLLQQRDHHDTRFAFRWCFPGGACEGSEEYGHALEREAKEEFDVSLDSRRCQLMMKRLGDQNWVYLCPASDFESLTQHEGLAMRWMTIDEVQDLDLGWNQQDIVPVLKEALANLMN